ncbi:S8 family peptidase [Niabella pedocola]|uniref:S8 family peptidase n=1 Tax=Niabella pedocola TaxID=1752077 RepID=A0ABS8PVM3_9BACT|nr:S8 family peptidase [Niabella pedocola]MCD2424322.1 S8 family peptidase [Niabella pedocola]
MPDFPHLTLKQKIDGRYKFAKRRIEKDVDPQTEANLLNRQLHAARLSAESQNVLQNYNSYLRKREDLGLPAIFDENAVPLFLQIDPKDFDIESLKGFGIEIVSEEENGFIIGANTDNFQSLADKIDKFINENGRSKDQAAKLWQIVQGNQWRIEYILSESLREKYIAGITDDDQFTVDVSIACYIKLPERPLKIEDESDEDYLQALAKHSEKNELQGERKPFRAQRVGETDESFNAKLNRWQKKLLEAEMQRDEIAASRQDFLTNFIETLYQGQIVSSFIDLQDSFGFRANMSGQALKDLINGYAYVFEISEADNIEVEETITDIDNLMDVEIIAPNPEAPTICIIDSGIQEEHILLAPAVLSPLSMNYVPEENTTSDQVPNGGHGTKVAGAILYGNQIPERGQYQAPCFLMNARILNSSNKLPQSLYPPQLMKEIVDDFKDVRIFNMSVAADGTCRTVHMSTWAATIDQLTHERGILFLLACGNIRSTTRIPNRPGITEHLQSGRNYPDYLFEPTSRVSNPAQSLLGLTVGSVCHAEFEDADRMSFGKKDHISSFSRSGPGMWGCIKPEVVEYGGDFLREKNGYIITQHDTISTRVVKTGAGRVGWDIGTSFATPKVAHILAKLAIKFPNDSTLLYKALLVQSARLPEHVFHNPDTQALRLLGYGIPDVNRAIENTPYRITFVAEGKVAAQQANLYSLNIPQELRRAGSDFDVLVEVTLTYTAAPRRTRKRLKSYFGSWLTWESSKLGENFKTFSARVLKHFEKPDDETIDSDSIKWSISTSPVYGKISDFKRQDSATQKDWVILKSNVLPEELSFAIVGHKGWDKDTAKEVPFALAISLEAISKQNEIYERIEVANRIELEEQVEIVVRE